MNGLIFPALLRNPEGIRFSEQEVNENIILFLRRHGITNLPWIIGAVIAFLLPFILVQLDLSLATNYILRISPSVLIGIIIVWYMLVMAFIIEQFLFWYFNIYIVTNFHIVDINFTSLLNRDITEIELKDIQSVKVDVKGVFPPLFNFGDVIIKTAADKQIIDFAKVPQPDFVADTIQDIAAHTGGTL